MNLKLGADSAFIIGQTHHDTAKPCQDYALSGCRRDLAWTVLADGCSTGGRTDLGARVWAHAGERALSEAGMRAMAGARECADLVHARAHPFLAPLQVEDGYATLLMAASDGETAKVLAFGDGVVAARYRDGRLKFWDINYSLNAPRYLQYATDPDLLTKWEALVAGSALRIFVNEYDEDGVLLKTNIETLPATTAGFEIDFKDLRDIEAVFICTDGAVSFEGRSAYESILPLTQVKNPVGQFIHRRLGALLRTWRKEGAKGPSDDLAVGALWFEYCPQAQGAEVDRNSTGGRIQGTSS